MMLAPDALGDRYHVSLDGDDIAWLWVDETSGKLYGMNPEYGVWALRGGDRYADDDPHGPRLDRTGHGRAFFTNIAYNPTTDVRSGGKVAPLRRWLIRPMARRQGQPD